MSSNSNFVPTPLTFQPSQQSDESTTASKPPQTTPLSDTPAATPNVPPMASPTAQPTKVPYKPVISDFKLYHIVGEGAYAKVYFAQNHKTGQFFGIKLVDKDHVARNNKVESVTVERNALTTLKGHPGVVSLTYTLQDSYSLYFALEFCLGGELYDQLKHFNTLSLETARFYAAELVEIIHFMHLKNVIHRDLKPSNILLTEQGHLKVCDFGTSKILTGTEPAIPPQLVEKLNQRDAYAALGMTPDEILAKEATAQEDNFDFDAALNARNDTTTRKESFVGTALYCYPEMLDSHYLTFGADWWSFGVILYEMLVGTSPFDAESEYLIFQKIQSGTALTLPRHMEPHAHELVPELLHPDPRQRLGTRYEQEREIFQHPFFKPQWTLCRVEAIKQLNKDTILQLLDSGEINSLTASMSNLQQFTSRDSIWANNTSNSSNNNSGANSSGSTSITQISGVDMSTEEYKLLFRNTKPLSIFALTPPTYWINEDVIAPNKKIILEYRARREQEKAAAAASVTASTPQSTSQTPLQSPQPIQPLKSTDSTPTDSKEDTNEPEKLDLGGQSSDPRILPSTNPDPPASNLSINLTTTTTTTARSSNAGITNHSNGSNSASQPPTPSASITSPTLANFTPTDSAQQKRLQFLFQMSQQNLAGDSPGDATAASPTLSPRSQQSRLLATPAEDGGLITSTSNVQSMSQQGLVGSPSSLPRLSTPGQSIVGSSSILSAVIGQPDYKQHFDQIVRDPQFNQERWEAHLRPGEHIVALGLIVKNNRWSSTFFLKKRQLLLTSQCRLIYIDEQKQEVKGEIPIIGDGYTFKTIDGKTFEITAADDEHRTYRIQCQQPPTFAHWFIQPHRNEAPPCVTSW